MLLGKNIYQKSICTLSSNFLENRIIFWKKMAEIDAIKFILQDKNFNRHQLHNHPIHRHHYSHHLQSHHLTDLVS